MPPHLLGRHLHFPPVRNIDCSQIDQAGSGMKNPAKRPWTIEQWRIDNKSVDKHWRDSLSIVDADGGEVCVLTRGYEAGVDGSGGPSWKNAELIVAAVNAHLELTQLSAVAEEIFAQNLCTFRDIEGFRAIMKIANVPRETIDSDSAL
jgi:hypothetical protein